MAYGPLAILNALNAGANIDLDEVNRALQSDLGGNAGDSAFRPGETPALDALVFGSTNGGLGGSSTPQFNFSDIFPDTVPMSGIEATADITPASLETGGSPVATGFEIFSRSFDMLMQAEASRRQAVDQQISLAGLFAELNRASPTQAAEMATLLGMPELEPNLEWLNRFSEGSHFNIAGPVGSQNVSLPWMLSGSQLSFLRDRPNVTNVFEDVGDFLGRPDIISESIASLIPTSGAVAGWAF